MFDCLRLLFAKGTQGVCGGVEEIGVGFQQWSMASSQARKEDRVHSVASGHAILRPGEPAIHLRYPRVCWWWIYKCFADEGSRGCIGNGPKRVAQLLTLSMQLDRTPLEVLLYPSRSLPPTLKGCWRLQGSPSGRPLTLKLQQQQPQAPRVDNTLMHRCQAKYGFLSNSI